MLHTHHMHRLTRRAANNYAQRHSSRQCQGAATSAAKMNGRTGFEVRSNQIWIPGEGWVYWADIELQVAAAFRLWQHKQAERVMRLMKHWHAA